MTDEPGADELRARRWLRRRGVGPDAHPAPTPPPSKPTGPEEQPAPDWWDRLYPDEEPAGPDEDEPDGDEERPWWSLHRPGPTEPPHQAQPQVTQDATGLHITINQGPTTAPATPSRADHQRARRTRWLAFHGTAATAGWCLGMESVMAAFLDSTGPRAPAAGIGLCLIAAIPAIWMPGLPYIPPPLRPATVWLSRIPVATAVLTLALHAPGTLT